MRINCTFFVLITSSSITLLAPLMLYHVFLSGERSVWHGVFFLITGNAEYGMRRMRLYTQSKALGLVACYPRLCIFFAKAVYYNGGFIRITLLLRGRKSWLYEHLLRENKIQETQTQRRNTHTHTSSSSFTPEKGERERFYAYCCVWIEV